MMAAAVNSSNPGSRPAAAVANAGGNVAHFYSPAVLGTNRTSMVKSTAAFDRNRNLRGQVERAIKEHKVYTCIGVYPAIRKALQARGWVEKNLSILTARSQNFGSGGGGRDFDTRSLEEESDQAWMNRVLRDYPPDLIWTIRRDNIEWRALHKDQIVNRFPKAFFTTKVGIAAAIQNMQWFSESGISDTFFPRCYRLCIDEEKAAFIDDYRLTACMGLLKWVVNGYEKDGESGVMDPSGRVVSLAVDFAVRQINNYVRMRRHEDIDWLMSPAFMGQHWDVFLSQYHTVVVMRGKLIPDGQDSAKMKYEAAKRALQRLAPFWPQLNVDGVYNIWICKPGARSRGKGIVLMNQLDKILELLAQSNCREANWVVQKYIERPLLIYHTKFDIRQWFIVSDWSPLTIWFYKESYIRFCTKPFSLEDFHESVHLCNNAIQCRYQNAESRDSSLPDENMWDCYTFQAYLKTQGKMDLWDTQIYPGMKQGIIGVLLASQETTDVRKNCFELYGADFMLSEDLRPWLIEINSCPCMSASTSVTARMCAQCLEDTIKVVVDRRDDRNADTGMFEMIYRQNQSMINVPFNGIDLVVQGKKLTRDVDWPSIMTKYNSRRIGSRSSTSSRLLPIKNSNPLLEGNGLTFMDLVQRLRLKQTEGSIVYNNNAITQKTPSALAALMNRPKEPLQAQKNTTDNSAKPEQKSSNNNNTSPRPVTNPKSGGYNAALTTERIESLKKNYIHLGNTKTIVNEKSSVTSQKSTRSNPPVPQHQNTETLLSTLLKNSTTGSPTMADLVRLSKEANESLRPKTPPPASVSRGASQDESSSSASAKERPKSLTLPSPLSAPPTSRQHTNGPMKPNARTNSSLPHPAQQPANEMKKVTSAAPHQLNANQRISGNSNNTPNAASTHVKDSTSTGAGHVGAKYGKIPSSINETYTFNTSHDSLSSSQSQDDSESHDSLSNNGNCVTNDNLNSDGSTKITYESNTDSSHCTSSSSSSVVDSLTMFANNDKGTHFSSTTDPEPNIKHKSEGHGQNILTEPGAAAAAERRSIKPKQSSVLRRSKGRSKHPSLHHRRKLIYRQPHVCYRVALEHPTDPAALFSHRKKLISLPLKTVHLQII